MILFEWKNFVCMFLLGFVTLDGLASERYKRHVPSPDWQKQIIYFIMIDRFNDGDPANNDQGAGEYDPADPRKFSGGDLQGIVDKLDYIQNLGATAIWITPPVANQWWDPMVDYGGYHGYWAENFKAVDAHFGNLETYKTLSDELHRRAMYLIQDIVVNHTGNFFEYKGEFDEQDPARNLVLNTKTVPVTHPSQFPFSLNNVLQKKDREASIYHWTPAIVEYSNPTERLTYQLSGLDDLNTQNPVVRKALRDAFGYWVREVGVDGFRIDTIIYVEDDFWHDFLHSDDRHAPGIDVVARRTGRDDFLTFGEAFIGAEPLDDKGDRKVAAYIGSEKKPGLKAVLNFPLYFTIGRVFGQGQPTSYLSYRLKSFMNHEIYTNPYIQPTFIDNHDTQRFIGTAPIGALKQALLFMFTIPGIPVVYQGTEQLFSKERAAMFAQGWGAGGADHFDEASDMFKYISKLAGLRKSNNVLTHGNLTLLQDSPKGAGVFAYKRAYQNQTALILFNTSEQRILAANLKTGLTSRDRLEPLHNTGPPNSLNIDSHGMLTVELPPRHAGIFKVAGPNTDVEYSTDLISINSLPGKPIRQDFVVSGKINTSQGPAMLVFDEKLDNAIEIEADQTGTWETDIKISRFPLGKSTHTLNAYLPEKNWASPTLTFDTDVTGAGASRTVLDPLGDDRGPGGYYRKPSDPSFAGQMDIREVAIATFGGNLEVTLKMAGLTTVWNPPNGFDHVVFHIFIDLPGQPGTDFLPVLNAGCPPNFEWNYMSYAGGWNNILFHNANASAENFGTFRIPAPKIEADPDSNTITFSFPPDALGNPASLSGAKIYVTTWDGGGAEGFHRPLTMQGGAFEFGGRRAANDPLIMDASEIVIIP